MLQPWHYERHIGGLLDFPFAFGRHDYPAGSYLEQLHIKEQNTLDQRFFIHVDAAVVNILAFDATVANNQMPMDFDQFKAEVYNQNDVPGMQSILLDLTAWAVNSRPTSNYRTFWDVRYLKKTVNRQVAPLSQLQNIRRLSAPRNLAAPPQAQGTPANAASPPQAQGPPAAPQ
jgi:hypothetical protein